MDYKLKQDAMDKLRGLQFEDERQQLLEKLKAIGGEKERNPFGQDIDSGYNQYKEIINQPSAMNDDEMLEMIRAKIKHLV